MYPTQSTTAAETTQLETSKTTEAAAVMAMEDAPRIEAIVDAKEVEIVELVAAKKKRKKKDKEKAKKKVTAEGSNSGEVEVKETKVPVHVRKIQEEQARRREAEERRVKEEEERAREEEEARRREEELERREEEARRVKRERQKEKILRKKLEGKPVTAKQKEEARRLEAMRNQLVSIAALSKTETCAATVGPVKTTGAQLVDAVAGVVVVEVEEIVETMKEEDDDNDDDWDAKSWDDDKAVNNLVVKSEFADKVLKEEAEILVAEKKIKRNTSSSQAQLNKSVNDLRSPICCILGHVDAGKTKLLDCIRGTKVQEHEAGYITQQISAAYLPAENIRNRTKELKEDATLRVPGLLMIDTPGHEAFKNLRSRGSSLCDMAVLVVDIMHGLKPQTVEALNLLRMRNAKFIVALNKVDKLYGWKACPNAPIAKAMKQQSKDVQDEFRVKLNEICGQFKEQELNAELYYKKKHLGETINIIPTSAIKGEGIPDLLLLLVQWTQRTMVEKLMFSNEVQCTVMEVNVTEGHGTTIDVVLVNGVLHEGDQLVVCGMQGPIVTSIRALFTPEPKELQVKSRYLRHKEIKAAHCIKIAAQGLEYAIPGTSLYVTRPEDDLEDAKKLVMQDIDSVMSKIDKSGEGVCVQASTLGSLESLLEFLNSPEVNVPVSGISIGPVHKKDVTKANVMLERNKEYATILAFDVEVATDIRKLADAKGVKIFVADVLYELFDQFKAYINNLKEEKKKEAAVEAVFPCVLKILPKSIFNKKDPIVLGVVILDGIAKVGTPICIPTRDSATGNLVCIDIGRIASIEVNHNQVKLAQKGQKVAIKIVGTNAEERQKAYGRHFEIDDELISHITRSSIDALKANFREDLSREEWILVKKLKNLLKIQ